MNHSVPHIPRQPSSRSAQTTESPRYLDITTTMCIDSTTAMPLPRCV